MIKDRQTYLKVNLDNILENYNNIKNSLYGKDIMAVIKADAYGNGAATIGKYLYNNGVKVFGVATLEEALEIREVAEKSLVLVLGVANPKNIQYAINNNISLCCPSLIWLEEATKNLENCTGKLKIHLKIDSGMARIGVYTAEEMIAVNKLLKNNKIELEGIFTHYANADDEDNSFVLQQRERFSELVKLVDKIPTYIHQENTAATMRYAKEETKLNLVRVGISLYGEYPSEIIENKTAIKLKNVTSLISTVAHVKKIPSNAKVGYGLTYESAETEYIATLPIGYRDGVIRQAQGWKVMVNGKLCEIVGRVCMDQLMIRVDKDVKIGDEVLFYGEHNGDKLSAVEYAKHLNTIVYEVFCNSGSRIERRYFVNNEEVEI